MREKEGNGEKNEHREKFDRLKTNSLKGSLSYFSHMLLKKNTATQVLNGSRLIHCSGFSTTRFRLNVSSYSLIKMGTSVRPTWDCVGRDRKGSCLNVKEKKKRGGGGGGGRETKK
jgi:hypothetical protein